MVGRASAIGAGRGKGIVSYRSRTLFILAVLASATAAGAAALRWQSWTPVTACLLCEVPDAESRAVAAAANPEAAIGTGGAVARSATPTGSIDLGSAAPAPPADETSDASGAISRFSSAPRGWQPWSSGTGSFRGSSSAASGPSATLGGLWRLMSLSRPGHGGARLMATSAGDRAAGPIVSPGRPAAALAPPAASSGRTRRSASPAPLPPSLTPPADDPAPSDPASDPAPPADGPDDGAPPSAGAAPPLDPFHEHESAAPDPFGPPGGGFDPGVPGGGDASAPGGVSPTPEPGSVLLIGTGLVGILGALRRRRLI